LTGRRGAIKAKKRALRGLLSRAGVGGAQYDRNLNGSKDLGKVRGDEVERREKDKTMR